MGEPRRCSRVNPNNPKYIHYHDHERGIPVYDDRKLFEMLILEGAQAGLSRETILNKRQAYNEVFFDFDITTILAQDMSYFKSLLTNSNLVRNKLKIYSVPHNAKIFQTIQKEYGSFANYIWKRTKRKTIKTTFSPGAPTPTQNQLSETISKDLKKRGMKFVSPTIIYAYLEAIGIINSHHPTCFKG